MLQLGYILLTIVMALILIFGYNYALKKVNATHTERKKNVLLMVVGLLAWIVYTFFMAKSGILQDYSLPPKFPIFTIFPAFIFIGVILYRNRKKAIIKAIPKSWLIYYQSFRILIESLFVATVAAGFLQPEVTFEGYNFDIIFAITAPIIAYLAFNKKILSEKIVRYWNYLGLVVIAFIIFLFTTTTFFPSVWGSETSLATPEMTSVPFIFVATFLMPSAVFIHVLSIMQLSKK